MNFFSSDRYFLGIALSLAAFLYFFNLDNYYLGLDQGDYPLHALHILEYGVPYILGENPPYFDPRFAVHGVWGYHPWLSMYLVAGSIGLFGNTTFAGVFPTALCGVLSVLAIYYLAMLIHQNRWIARLAATFYLFSVPCILYMRTSRYLGPNLLLAIVVLICFIQLIQNQKIKIYPFCIGSILLFYAMYSQFFGLFLGLTLFSVLFIRDRLVIRKLIQSCAAIAVFTLPWFLYYFLPARKNIAEVYSIYFNEEYAKSTWTLFEFAVGYLAQVNSYFLPVFLLILFFLLKKYFPKLDYSWDQNKTLLTLCCAGMIFVATFHAIPLFNYVLGTIPIFFIFLAEICFKIVQRKAVAGIAILIILLFTNWLHIAPWFLFDKIVAPAVAASGLHPDFSSNSILKRWARSIRNNNKPDYYFLNYLKEISNQFNGPLKAIVTYLDQNANPGDRFVVSHEGDSIHFYTRLRWANDFPFKSSPQWIIPRGPRKHFSQMGRFNTKEETRKTTAYVYQYLETHPYEKIVLDVWDHGTENSYNLQNHSFSNHPGKYKVTLYRYVDPGKNQ